MSILNLLRKPYFSILLAFLVLFVSCSKYDSKPIENGLDAQTIAKLKQATIEFVDHAKNNPQSLNKTTNEDYIGLEDVLINEALRIYVNDNLELYKENVVNFSEWNNDQLNAIEAIFVVLETIKDNFTLEEAAKFNQTIYKESCGDGGAWWAPLALWGVCTVVGVLTVGIAGIACAGLVAARVSYCNYQK
ncbi:MAG: hypothetical protein O2831_06870 [Bacteroidetes bacterium]|nr:hypothetical protein [Bacteroidota bacterium]